MTRPWLIESKLYAALCRYPERIWSLGLYIDTDALPWRLEWRCAVSAQRGFVCQFHQNRAEFYINLAVGTLKKLRESERKLNQPMLWPEEYLRTRQEDAWRNRAA